jgi:aminoglycoside phosphotransferase (APT) family kinase protein
MSTNDFSAFTAWVDRELGIPGAKILRELSGGNSNLTRLVESSAGLMVMRSAPASTISPKAHLGVQREAAFMGALAGHAPVPKVMAWCEDTDIIGQPFALVEHIDGLSITNEMPQTYGAVEDVNKLGLDLASALGQIAIAPWQDIGLADWGRPDNFLLRQIERWLGIRRDQPTRDLPEMERLGQWLLENMPNEGPVGVVHGDYHLDNSLCHRERPDLLAVIDWEMATIGDPLTDLGLFLMFWGPRAIDPPGFAHVQAVSRMEGVLPRADLARQWAASSGLSADHLNFYLCFAFWRLAAIVEGAYGLYVQGKVNTDYARGLEWDVPALLHEAALAAEGEW